MIDKKSWKEFRETGLLFFINQILHVFGWAIVIVIDNGIVTDAYPARVKFRGFSADVIDKGYTQVTQYLKDNVSELLTECESINKPESEDKE